MKNEQKEPELITVREFLKRFRTENTEGYGNWTPQKVNYQKKSKRPKIRFKILPLL